jgi:putative ABC transport system substrate-binding protein
MTVHDRYITVVTILAMLCPAGGGIAAARTDEAVVFVIKARPSQPYEDVFAGFKRLLDERGIPVRYEVYDVGGGEGDLDRILENPGARDADMLFAIGTSVAQRAVEKNLGVPIVYSMVMDTIGLNGADDATGVTLEFAVACHFQWMKQFLPKAKRVGVIYNPEKNKERIGLAKREAEKNGLILETHEVNKPQDIPAALERISNNVDVLWGIPDEVVLNPQTAKQILLFCYRNRVPFVGPSEAWVKAGALYALDRDYAAIGAQCGKMAMALLNGTRPEAIESETPDKITYFVNLKTAQHMKVDINKDLLAKANGVY